MITVYPNGNEFLKDNEAFLLTNKYQAVFFFYDAPLLKETNTINYALKIVNEDKKLIALKVEPYNLMLFGDKELCEELIDYCFDNFYEIKNYLCSEEIGEQFKLIIENKYKCLYSEELAMDFMECKQIIEPASKEVIKVDENDLKEIVELEELFKIDCNLLDKINPEKIKKELPYYRVIKKDGKIVSMAKATIASESDYRISAVFTRKEYRDEGLARKVVNTVKNEIINEGKVATLNVDKRNPISNHLYSSLGFTKVFSQGEYRRIK